FFFPAEDGIRCFHVTGVQTCALPIYALSAGKKAGTGHGPGWYRRKAAETAYHRWAAGRPVAPAGDGVKASRPDPGYSFHVRASRSEERRVGKEGRARWTPPQAKKRGG